MKARHKQLNLLLCQRCVSLTHGKMVPGVQDFSQRRASDKDLPKVHLDHVMERRAGVVWCGWVGGGEKGMLGHMQVWERPFPTVWHSAQSNQTATPLPINIIAARQSYTRRSPSLRMAWVETLTSPTACGRCCSRPRS